MLFAFVFLSARHSEHSFVQLRKKDTTTGRKEEIQPVIVMMLAETSKKFLWDFPFRVNVCLQPGEKQLAVHWSLILS